MIGHPFETPLMNFEKSNALRQTTMEPVMNWNELIAEVTAVGSGGGADGPVTGVEYDSRRVRPGSVFVAMKGGSTDGNRYVEKAIASGALGVITDSSQKFDHLLVFEAGLPVFEVEHGRRALAQASAAFFGHPERKLAATGHHRHQWQDDHCFSNRVAAERCLA